MIIYYDNGFCLHEGVYADFKSVYVQMRNFGVLPMEFCPEYEHVAND